MSDAYKPTIVINQNHISLEFFEQLLKEKNYTLEYLYDEFWSVCSNNEEQIIQIIKEPDINQFQQFVDMTLSTYLNTEIDKDYTKPKSDKEDYFKVQGSPKFVENIMFVVGTFIIIQHAYMLKQMADERKRYSEITCDKDSVCEESS